MNSNVRRPNRIRPKFTNLLPDLAAEVASLLEQEGRTALAHQVPDLLVRDRCRCGDSFCGMFYTAPPPDGAWGPGHESIPLDSEKGMIVLDVVEGRISAVEVLYRDDVREKLLELLP